MLRPLEDVVRAAGFNHDTVFHYEHSLAQVADDTEIVRDEQVTHAGLTLKCHEQVEDLSLDGHVQRRHGLVEHDHRRPGRERSRNGNALPLTAGHAQRESVEHVSGQSDLIEQFGHSCATRGDGSEPLAAKGIEQDALDIPSRIERTQRILVDN
jgi:hypothetical protein